jgi:hypothetical protein
MSGQNRITGNYLSTMSPSDEAEAKMMVDSRIADLNYALARLDNIRDQLLKLA